MSPAARTQTSPARAAKPGPFGAKEPRGHSGVIERLFEAARKARLPSALLFEGPEGTGKFTAMSWLAAGLLCELGPGPACGQCGPCKRTRSGNHPDLFVVDPKADGEEHLRITRIAYRPDAPNNPTPENCVESFLNLCAVESKIRPVLLRDCHRMNSAAQNALLKTLEEPRPGVVLLLETHRSDLLLDTILSRCVRLRSGPLDLEHGRAVLEELGIDAERATSLVRWAEGSPGQALALMERGGEEAVACLVGVLSGKLDPMAAAASLAELKGRFIGATPSAKARDRARLVLDLVIALARDAHRLEVGGDPEGLPFGSELQGARSPAGWAKRLETLLSCRADVDRNVGPDALFEYSLLVLGS